MTYWACQGYLDGYLPRGLEAHNSRIGGPSGSHRRHRISLRPAKNPVRPRRSPRRGLIPVVAVDAPGGRDSLRRFAEDEHRGRASLLFRSLVGNLRWSCVLCVLCLLCWRMFRSRSRNIQRFVEVTSYNYGLQWIVPKTGFDPRAFRSPTDASALTPSKIVEAARAAEAN